PGAGAAVLESAAAGWAKVTGTNANARAETEVLSRNEDIGIIRESSLGLVAGILCANVRIDESRFVNS
ncbi:hypothetical protein, partial [Achromobacter xylosoxidans]|uniref:hypothetical protein n=1 Tax=Alcaligenes xylosoxydans xylosoxydans TaxID=85698 RepID=UPI001E4FD4A3